MRRSRLQKHVGILHVRVTEERFEECTCTSIQTCRCVCPLGFSYQPHSRQCKDVDECAGGRTACGNADCLNTLGTFACSCPSGYEYNLRLSICVQAMLACQQACAYGCAGADCACPRGFARLNADHCLRSVSGALRITPAQVKEACVEYLC